MTILNSGVAIIKCDDAIHRGENRFRVEWPHTIALESALRKRGWRGNAHASEHQCPVCAARRIGKINGHR